MNVSIVIPFLKAYGKSMRIYYSFVTGIAGWVGVSYYQYVANTVGPRGTSGLERTVEMPVTVGKQAVIILILFLAWGINQIVNDFLGYKEDRINAPMRPMVTGELNRYHAMALSLCFMAVIFFVTWFYLEPIAVVPLVAGALLNVLYEYAKGHGLWGNLVFGVMISMCGLYGFWASGPLEIYLTRSRYSALALIAVMNALMTYYTYFKDYTGDKAAGKNTVVVKYGLERNKFISIAASFLPSVMFLASYYGFNGFEIELNSTFVILGLMTVFLQIWTGVLYYRNPQGEMTYYSLVTNFRACTCGQATIVALFNPELGLILYLLAYVFVGFLFNLHTNIKA